MPLTTGITEFAKCTVYCKACIFVFCVMLLCIAAVQCCGAEFLFDDNNATGYILVDKLKHIFDSPPFLTCLISEPLPHAETNASSYGK